MALPKEKYGQAVNYALSQKDKVMRVLEDGHLELENNLAGRAEKPFVIGLIPYEYLKYLMEEIPGKRLTDDYIDSLLPWSEKIPKYAISPAE